MRKKVPAIGTAGAVEYIPEGAVVVVTSEETMRVLIVQSQGRSLTVFARDLEAHAEERKASEDPGESE